MIGLNHCPAKLPGVADYLFQLAAKRFFSVPSNVELMKALAKR